MKKHTAELEETYKILKLHDKEHKKAEEILKVSEEKYRNMIEQFPAVIVVINKLGYIVSCNNALKRITGYSEDELVGNHFTKLNAFRLKDVPKYLGLFKKALKGEISNPLEIDFIRRDGSNGTVEIHVSLLNDGKIQAIATDITDRKKTEESLQESENRYKAVVNNAAEGITVVQDGMLRFVNPHLITIAGYSEMELTSRSFVEFVHPDDREQVMKIHLKRFKGEEVPPVYEIRIIDKQGNTKWLENNGILIEWEGRPATLNFLRDVTERKRAEEALQKERRLNDELFKTTPTFAVAIDAKGKTVMMNDAMCNALGYTFDEICGTDYLTTFIPARDKERLAETFEILTTTNDSVAIENHVLAKNGQELLVDWRGSQIYNSKGELEFFFGVGIDITESKKAEEQLLHYQEKLKSLASQLSLLEERERRRIATDLHDQIGQSLVFTKIKLDELQQSVKSSEHAKALDDICKNIDQVIQDTKTLTFDLSSPILYELGFEAAVSEWLIRHVRDKHGIETEFQDDGQLKLLDEDIQSILFRNVRELLTNVIKHANAQKVRISVSKVNRQICVIIEDDGVGFDTTEVASKATFGLFSIREQLEHLDGSLKIESEPGRGSMMTMIAPLK